MTIDTHTDRPKTIVDPDELVGYHTNHHCSCGNWCGVGSPCLYGFNEAVTEGVENNLDWHLRSMGRNPSMLKGFGDQIALRVARRLLAEQGSNPLGTTPRVVTDDEPDKPNTASHPQAITTG